MAKPLLFRRNADRISQFSGGDEPDDTAAPSASDDIENLAELVSKTPPVARAHPSPPAEANRPRKEEEANRQKWLERFKPLTAAELDNLPPPRWLIKDYVPADGISRLCGAPSSAKSFIALDWGHR
jgi:hypothetical protein